MNTTSILFKPAGYSASSSVTILHSMRPLDRYTITFSTRLSRALTATRKRVVRWCTREHVGAVLAGILATTAFISSLMATGGASEAARPVAAVTASLALVVTLATAIPADVRARVMEQSTTKGGEK